MSFVLYEYLSDMDLAEKRRRWRFLLSSSIRSIIHCLCCGDPAVSCARNNTTTFWFCLSLCLRSRHCRFESFAVGLVVHQAALKRELLKQQKLSKAKFVLFFVSIVLTVEVLGHVLIMNKSGFCCAQRYSSCCNYLLHIHFAHLMARNCDTVATIVHVSGF